MALLIFLIWYLFWNQPCTDNLMFKNYAQVPVNVAIVSWNDKSGIPKHVTFYDNDVNPGENRTLQKPNADWSFEVVIRRSGMDSRFRLTDKLSSQGWSYLWKSVFKQNIQVVMNIMQDTPTLSTFENYIYSQILNNGNVTISEMSILDREVIVEGGPNFKPIKTDQGAVVQVLDDYRPFMIQSTRIRQ